MKGDNIADRLARFASSVITISRRLPRDEAGRYLRDQLARAGTSPGSHYAEARSAGSTKAFIYKLNLAASELREAGHHLDVVSRTEPRLANEIAAAQQECLELVAILVSSIRTAQRNARRETE